MRLFLLFLLLPAGLALEAQEAFEGSLVFQVSMQGPEAEQLKLNEPNTRLTMHLRGGDYIILLSGGQYPKTFLFLSDSNYEYSLDAASKRAFRFSPFSDLVRERDTAQARPTGRSAEVMGVLCQEYAMRSDDARFLFYVSDAYRVDRSRYPKRPRSKASFLAAGLEGRIPLKTVKQQKDLTVTTLITEIKPRALSQSQFLIPPGFVVHKRDYRY
jgi:hypothetical protein